MRRLAGLARQLIEMRLRLVPEPQPADGPSAELEQPEPERIAAGVGVAPDQPVLIEHREQAMNRALVQRQAVGHLAGGQFMGVLGQNLKDIDGAFEHLDAVGRSFCRGASHRAAPALRGPAADRVSRCESAFHTAAPEACQRSDECLENRHARFHDVGKCRAPRDSL